MGMGVSELPEAFELLEARNNTNVKGRRILAIIGLKLVIHRAYSNFRKL